MSSEQLMSFGLETLDPVDSPESSSSLNSSPNPNTTTSENFVNDLNPLRYQEFPDLSRGKAVRIPEIEGDCRDSIRKNFIDIEGMLPS